MPKRSPRKPMPPDLSSGDDFRRRAGKSISEADAVYDALAAPSPSSPAKADDPISEKIIADLPAFDEGRTADEIIRLRKDHASIVVAIGRRMEQARVHYLAQGARNDNFVYSLHKVKRGFSGFLEKCGVSRRNAYNYIMVVRRLAEAGLLMDSPNVLGLNAGVTKLLAITELDPEDIRALEGGEAIEGIGDLDEIDRMRVGELREKLRERKSEADRAREELRKSEATVEELSGEVEKWKREASQPDRYALPPIAEEFHRLLQPIHAFLDEASSRPKAERHEAYTPVVRMMDMLSRKLSAALYYEKTGDLPIPTVEPRPITHEDIDR